MKAAKTIVLLFGALLLFVALCGVVSLYRDYPRIVLGGITVLIVFSVFSFLSDRRIQRDLAAAETILAGLTCPRCGAIFGRDAASVAIHPPRLPDVKYRIDDDFGYSAITCPGCAARSMFHRRTHELKFSEQPKAA